MGGAFDCQNWQHSGEFDQNFSKKSNAPRGGWTVLELTGTLPLQIDAYFCYHNATKIWKLPSQWKGFSFFPCDVVWFSLFAPGCSNWMLKLLLLAIFIFWVNHRFINEASLQPPPFVLFYIYEFKTLTYLVILRVYADKSVICYTEKKHKIQRVK